MAFVDVTTPLKRPREDNQVPQLEGNKKHKSYNHILSILNDEEEEPITQDISSLITTLHQEISSGSTTFDHVPPLPTDPRENPSTVPSNSEDSSTSSVSDDKESVMRHLLEASDDELGIPATGYDEVGGVGDEFVVYDGLWEFEDEAANYYTLLQSELFM